MGALNVSQLNLTATGGRVKADFSNSVVPNRMMFQTSTLNDVTSVHCIPSGTGTSSGWHAHNGSDPLNAGRLSLLAGSVSAQIRSDAAGTGTYLPLEFYTGGVSRASIDANGVTSFAGNVILPSLNGGQLAGFRNKIINGKMEIAQRGTSFPALPAGAYYTVDRFGWYSPTPAVVTISQQTDVPSTAEFKNSLRLAVTTANASIASADAAHLFQGVEGSNVRDLVGRTFTISFWVRSSKVGTHCVFLFNEAADRSYVSEYTINSANTWEKKSITISGGLPQDGGWNWNNGVGFFLGWGLDSGADKKTTPGEWKVGTFTGTTNQVNCLDAVGNIFAITGVQLEVGSVATPFEHRPYGMELALCQRYYCRFNASKADSSFALAFVGTTTQIVGLLKFPVSMRIAPNALEQSGVATDYAIGAPGANITCSAVPAYSARTTVDHGQFTFTVASGLTIGNAALAKSATTAAFLAFSAEL